MKDEGKGTTERFSPMTIPASTHNQLKKHAKEYGGTIRGLAARYIREGMANDRKRLTLDEA